MTVTPIRRAPAATGKRSMSAVDFAKKNLDTGVVITSLRTGRGGVDLLADPAALKKFKVGSFDSTERHMGGKPLKNIVYAVPVPGPDDRPVKHIIVDAPFVQPNCGVGHKFLDLGPITKKGGTRTVVSDFTTLPAPRDGYVWKFEGRERGDFKYVEVPIDRAAVDAFNRMVRAFNAAITGGDAGYMMSANEALDIVHAANAGNGPDDLRISELWRGVVNHSLRLTPEASRIVNRFLIEVGIPGE